jgi:CheY-like chemotaxis protein
VDDHPENNSQLIAHLSDLGIGVVTSISTSDAVLQFEEKQFDRIISDMGRQEGERYNSKAGIDLTKTIRNIDKNIPIIILCSRRASIEYQEEAYEAGVNEITSSPTVLLNALNLNFRLMV